MKNILSVLVLAGSLCADGQQAVAADPMQPASQVRSAGDMTGSYVLGPDDEITIRGVGIEEISGQPVRIDMSGHLRLPLVGQFTVMGMTVAELETALAERLKVYVLKPELSISVTQQRSQPVSVLGAVRSPGVYQLQGRKTLIEVLSMASGLDKDSAGSTVKITRRREWGPLPLEGAHPDPSGEFTTADVDLRSILEADQPAANITLRPYDVVTVPPAELIYVVGQVQKSGGFPVNERKAMTVLEALSNAGGTDRAAAPQHARILRRQSASAERTEIAVNINKILSGEVPDITLLPRDILFIPSSAPKKAALRAVEAAIQVGTGIVIWRK